MQVLEVGNNVVLLRFLPDNRRLAVVTADDQRKVTFQVMSLSGGERVQLYVPDAELDAWWYHAWYGNAIEIHPNGESCYLAWGGRLYCFRTVDGESLPTPRELPANQVILGLDGERLVVGFRSHGASPEISGLTADARGGSILWRKTPAKEFAQVAGFLPDGERFVTIEEVVRIRSFATGDQLAIGRTKPVGSQQPRISRDGRYLAAMGYGNMYFWDLTTLEKPRKIGGSSNFGDFRSFAFHPGGNTVAVIHGAPTLIKLYEIESLKCIQKWNWKLGPLQSVAFSPDGTLGAAGSNDGRVVVWDVDA